MSANLLKGLGIITAGAAIAALGICVGELDDAPGASLVGILLMLCAVAAGTRIARRSN